MKHLLKIILLLLPGLSFAQDVFLDQPTKKQADSLELLLKHTDNDSIKMVAGNELGNYYLEKDNAKAYYYINQELLFARKLNQPLWQISAVDGLSYLQGQFGNYPESLRLANEGIKISENDDCEKNAWRVTEFAKDGNPHKAHLYLLANLYQKFAFLYKKAGNNAKSLSAYLKARKTSAIADDKVGLALNSEDLATYYLGVNKPDSALFFIKIAVAVTNASDFKLYLGNDLVILGRIYFVKRDYDAAKKTCFESIKVNREQNNAHGLPYGYVELAELYNSTGKIDSGIYYAKLALRDFNIQQDKQGTNEAYNDLFAAYKLQGRTDSAFLYLQRSKTLGDSLSAAEKIKVSQYLNAGFDEQLRVEELEKEKIQVQTRTRTYVMLGGIGIFLIIASILYRNNKQKQKANKVLESTLTNLKSTQTQLIQSEKMASLGELTAGIAHEIQNPLNFVNNFSEVSVELLEELKEEEEKGNKEDVIAIADDLTQNLEKIRHHGKRADAIVKGMLQHSQSGSGIKEPTNINSLADEYMRLAYHGLRAKDKSFNAEMVTHLDETLPKINVIPQDMGRVMLNLFNNAFYAVNQKQKTAGNDYKPTVEVTTFFLPLQGVGGLRVKDNGVGMPENIKEKSMQPFFTTKPTGEGTGLGLSLTYDMVVKGHGGNIMVNSVEGEGSEFIIQLPVN